jgi:hypothetical protein
MANQEQLQILQQGVEAWNQSRKQPSRNRIDLTGADLHGVDLRRADLTGALLHGTDLHGANLAWANVDCAELHGADLRGAKLSRTYFMGTELHEANLAGAELFATDFTHAALCGADLTEARLTEALFIDSDLYAVRGLETCRHTAPSTLDHRTLARSGPLPLAFLRGCGLPDALIDYLPSLLNEPFQFYSCFMSYASKDHAFAERLYADLQNKGVRCWYAPEDMKIGDEFRSRIDASIHVHDRLLLILSEHSIKSRWVQKEVETAFEKEEKENRLVLFPIRLDEAVMQIDVGWAADVRRQRHIGDFTQWKEHDAYQKAFTRLLRDLTATAQKPDASA